MQQAAHGAVIAWRGAADGEDAALIDFEPGLALAALTASRFGRLPGFLVAVAAIAIVVTAKTPFGRRVYAVGGNERAARLNGIRVSRVTVAVYVISGACAALAGMLLTSELGAAYPDTATTYELNAIAAAVLGGTALSGGRGTIVGTVMGAFVIGFLADGLVLVGVSTFWQSVVKGAVIILAIVLEQAQQRLQSRLSSRMS